MKTYFRIKCWLNNRWRTYYNKKYFDKFKAEELAKIKMSILNLPFDVQEFVEE